MKAEKEKKASSKIKLSSLLPLLCFAAVAGAWLLFYLLRVEKLIDADMSSEMVLSDMLAKQGRIITPDWKYSTEIRVLNNQIFFSLFLAISKSYKLSRLLSGVVLLAILGASYYYLCAQAGIKKYFPHTAALLFLPFSADYAYIVLYGLYYIPHIAISFTSAALIMHLSNTAEKKKKYILTALLMLLSFAACLGGPRQMVICYLPLLLLSVIQYLMRKSPVWYGAIIAFICGGAGYVVNRYVLTKTYHFNSWDGLNFTPFSFERAQTLFMGIMHEYGYTEESVFSAALIKNAACMIVIAAIILYYHGFIRNNEKKDKNEHFIALCAVMITAVYFLLYLFTDMYYEDRYALPVIVFAAPLLGFALKDAALEARCLDKKERFRPFIIPGAVIAAVLVAGAGRYPGLIRTDLTTALSEVSDSLVSQGYESGYASYWNGNIMTELSEGRFEMFNWDDYVDGKVDVEELYVWLQPVSHYDKKPEGKVFILLSSEEETLCPLVEYLTEEDVAFRNDAYVAYGFDSYEAMLCDLSDWIFDLNDEDSITNAESIEGSWVLHTGSSTSGPNMTLYKGCYEFSLSGKGLDKLDVITTRNFGEEFPDTEVISRNTHELILKINVSENSYHVEFDLQNTGEDDIRIDTAIVERSSDV